MIISVVFYQPKHVTRSSQIQQVGNRLYHLMGGAANPHCKRMGTYVSGESGPFLQSVYHISFAKNTCTPALLFNNSSLSLWSQFRCHFWETFLDSSRSLSSGPHHCSTYIKSLTIYVILQLEYKSLRIETVLFGHLLLVTRLIRSIALLYL